ncbi:MAG TPA: rhomboid family intramembrane serine protease [Candidatus Methanoperedens sp.]|nr:rhomboid family intramembrane serine protease [Candidatus Methanoperedens sp.]
MRRSPYAQGFSLGFGRPWTPAVRALILACGGGYLAQLLLGRALPLHELFALDTARPLEFWRWLTYALLHDGPFHLLFNALGIWMFGSDVEERLGTRRFAAFCAISCAGAAASVLLVDRLLGRESIVIGASGVVFGLLLAYGLLFAERVITLLVFFVLPVSLKARHFVVAFGALELLFGMAGGTRVAHFAHLGGMLFGWLFLRGIGGRSPVSRRVAAPDSRRGDLLEALRERLAAFTRARDDRRMDELLQKVNASGIASLTEGEKRFLHRMSRRKRWH